MSGEKSEAWEKAQAAATAEFEAIDKAVSLTIDGLASGLVKAVSK